MVSTLLKLVFNQSKCFKLKSCCEAFCLIGIETAIVLKPVLQHRVLVTAESIPPETPIIRLGD